MATRYEYLAIINLEVYLSNLFKLVFSGSITSVFTSNEDVLTSMDAPCSPASMTSLKLTMLDPLKPSFEEKSNSNKSEILFAVESAMPSILNNKPFTVVGDGTQTRDFTFVTDAVDAIITAAEINVSGEIINIGSDNTYSVNQLVNLLGGDVVHIPKRPGEPDCTWADISKAIKLLNWHPKVSLEEGVGILLDNIDYWREAPVWDEKSIAVATEKWFEYLS